MPNEFEICYACGRYYFYREARYYGPYSNRRDAILAAQTAAGIWRRA